jgi:hypothetical protein
VAVCHFAQGCLKSCISATALASLQRFAGS